MWKNRIAYLILWISALALYIFYVGYTSYFLFLLVTSLPFLSLFYLLIGKRRLEVRLAVKKEIYKQGDKLQIHIYSRTKSIIPLARIQGLIYIENVFTQEKKKEQTVFTSEKNISEITVPIEAVHCGRMQVKLSDLYVYDILGLFHIRKRLTSSIEYYVFPVPFPSTYEILSSTQENEAEYDPNRSGNDPGETFDVHSYQPGDSLHKIHWKLSAKLDEIMVRDFSMPCDHHVTIAYELYGSLQDAEQILGYVYGFSLDLLQRQKQHTIQRFSKGVRLSSDTIAKTEDLVQYIKAVVASSITLDTKANLPIYSDPDAAMFYMKKDGLQFLQKGENHYG